MNILNLIPEKVTVAKNQMTKIVLYRGPLLNFVWSVAAALIPLWLGLLLLMAYGKWTGDFLPFYGNGEFYLYSSAFFANAIYLLRKRKSEEGDVPFTVTLTAALLLVVVAALYASLNTSQTIFAKAIAFDRTFLWHSSLYLFLASIAFSLYATITDFDPTTLPTNRKIRDDQVDDLERAFDAEKS
jgi:hypothetical protein